MIPMVEGVEGNDQKGTPVPTIDVASSIGIGVDLLLVFVVGAHVIVVVSLATMTAARQPRSKRQ